MKDQSPPPGFREFQRSSSTQEKPVRASQVVELFRQLSLLDVLLRSRTNTRETRP